MTTLDTSEGNRSGKDLFSLLPNEILQDIFDQAIDSRTPVDLTISKRLLPLVQASFYRHLYLDSLASFSHLVRTIQSRPHFGSTTQHLDLDFFDDDGTDNSCLVDASRVNFLMSQFINLKSFSSTQPLPAPSLSPSESISVNLRSVAVAVTSQEGVIVRFRKLAKWLSALPALEELSFTDWHLYPPQSPPLPYKFDRVKSLKVAGGGVAEAELSILIDCFPQLKELSLVLQDIFDWNLDFDEILSCLTAHFDRLESLSITSDPDEIYLGSSLAKFTSLQRLHLSLPESYPELHEAVLKLVNLKSFDISCPQYSLNEVLDLIEGPNRLLHLRSLKLNQVDAWEGELMDPDLPVEVSSFKERKYERFADWNIDDIDPRTTDFLEKREEVIKAAESAGIALEGSVLEARQVYLSYLLELNNLAVADAFFHRQYKGIPPARTLATRFGLELPELDFGSMDPEKLELVKVPVPELYWFALTLRDEVGESGIEGR